MDLFLLIINIVSFSFGLFAFFIVVYLTALYKNRLLKRIRAFLSFVFISYLLGIIYYLIELFFKVTYILNRVFPSFQFIIIIFVLYLLLDFVHDFTGVKKNLVRRIIQYSLIIPLFFEILFYTINLDIRFYCSFYFQLYYLYSGLFFIGKGLLDDWSKSNEKIFKMKKRFRIIYLLTLVVFIPFIIYADIMFLINKPLITWEPFFFLHFSICTLVFSIKYVVYQSQKNINESHIKGNMEAFLEKYEISNREADVLLLLLKNKKYKDIGDELCISLPTVKTHVSRIYKKVDVAGKSDLKHKFLGFTGC